MRRRWDDDVKAVARFLSSLLFIISLTGFVFAMIRVYQMESSKHYYPNTGTTFEIACVCAVGMIIGFLGATSPLR